MKDDTETANKANVEKNQPETSEDENECTNLWFKYWKMDPENFLWGINPNEKPPDVVIKQVVLTQKKNQWSAENALSNSCELKAKENCVGTNQESSEDGIITELHKNPGDKSKMCKLM